MLMSRCVVGFAWLMTHTTKRAVCKGEKEALHEDSEGIRKPERRVAGDCIVSHWWKKKIQWRPNSPGRYDHKS